MATNTTRIENQEQLKEYLSRFEETVYNTAMTRSMFFSEVLDRRAKVDSACGYPTSVGVEAMRDMYDREPIPNRVVNLWPRESWQVQPEIIETDDRTATEFEGVWEEICQSIHGEQNYYQDAIGSGMWEYLWRADELSGIGTFGILLMGIADGKLLEQPVDGSPPDGNPYTVPNIASSGMPAGARTIPGAFGSQAGVDEIPTEGPGRAQETTKSIYGNPQSEVTPETSMQDEYASVSRDIYGGATQNPLSSTLGTDAQYRGIQFTPGFYPSGDPYGPINPYAMPNMPMKRAVGGEKEKNGKISAGYGGKNGVQQIPNKLMFLRVFDESLVQVVQYEADLRNPRFGQPIMYLVTLNDPRYPHTGIGLPLATLRVHWSRVIHLADNIRSSEIFGLPRMKPVFNRLLDLRKLYGGSAEMYWQGALPGISFETHPQMGGDVQVDIPEMKEMIRNYVEGLERFLQLKGMTARTLAPTVVDPSNQVQTQIEAICIQLGVPIRVFKGSERGELASSQDDAAWNDRLRHRQMTYINPRVITPFVNRLITLGILPRPKGYSIKWPDLDSQTDAAKAAIAMQKTQAITTFSGGAPESIMTPVRFYTDILNIEEDRAEVIVAEAQQAIEAAQAQTAAMQKHQSGQEQGEQQEDRGPQESHEQEMKEAKKGKKKDSDHKKTTHNQVTNAGITREHFHQLADLQRDKPESAMLRVQFALGGGILNPVVEHVGDLTHRMSERPTFSSAGYEFVKPKVERSLYHLTRGWEHDFGDPTDTFRSEMEQNIKNNAKYKGTPVAIYRKKLHAAMDKYAEEHAKLPAYNDAQRHARDAAVEVGRRNFNAAVKHLRQLHKNLGSREDWVKYAHEGLGEQEQTNNKEVKKDDIPIAYYPPYGTSRLVEVECNGETRYLPVGHVYDCDPPKVANQSHPIASGLAVVAKDTGRVLMIQRALTENASRKEMRESFHNTLLERPLDSAIHNIYADWLEEQGTPEDEVRRHRLIGEALDKGRLSRAAHLASRKAYVKSQAANDTPSESKKSVEYRSVPVETTMASMYAQRADERAGSEGSISDIVRENHREAREAHSQARHRHLREAEQAGLTTTGKQPNLEAARAHEQAAAMHQAVADAMRRNPNE